MPPEAIGIAGTLFLYRDRVRIVAGRYEAVHARLFERGAKSTLPEHRAQLVAAVSGQRAKRYLKREQLLELGPAALEYLTEVVHRRPRAWVPEVDALHGLLQQHGAEPLRQAFVRAVEQSTYGTEYVTHYLRELAAPAQTELPLVKPADIPLDRLFRRLHLANAPRIYRALAEKAEQGQWSYRDFLAVLVAEEIAHRQQTRVQRLTRRARFPFLKTVEEFDFTYQSTLRLSLLGSALSPDFVTEGRSLILSGKSGRGKTHLAVAIAYRAIQNGFEARFTTAAALIDDLSRASREGRLVEALVPYTHPALLVIDEVGYLSYGTDAANLLFHVVNDRHLRRRSMVFTTNKPLDAWGRVLHDPDLAAAIVDRILERGRILRLDGPSLRTKHLGLDDPTVAEASTQPARISGIDRQEFPEPTTGGPDPSSASRGS
jgi:DNA replication protein DnaC